MPRQKYSRTRERTISEALTRLIQKVTRFQRDLVNTLLDYFLDKFRLRDSKIEVDPRNFGVVNAVRKIYEDWNEPRQREILKTVVDSLTELHSNNRDYFNQFSDGDITPDSEKVFTDMMKRLGYDRGKGSLTRGGYLETVLQSDDPVLQIKTEALRAVITGRSIADFKKDLDIIARGNSTTPGILEKHYGTHLYDIFQQYDREVGKLLAEKLGLKFAIYQGGLIKTSRPFCIERNDKIFTADEISQFGTSKDKYGGYENKSTGYFQGKPQVYNPFVDLGGYNCRHQLDWVSNEIGELLRADQDGANFKA